MDAYQMSLEIREQIGEAAEAHWTDAGILRKLNLHYRNLWMELAMQGGDWLGASTSLTAVASVLTLPSDCGKPIYVEDSNGYKIPIVGTVREKRLTDPAGLSLEVRGTVCYPLGNTLVINDAANTGTYTVWYIKRYQDMHFGVAGASSGAAALHFESTNVPRMSNDYYNDLGVRWYVASTGAIVTEDTITDYVGSTMVATVTGTPTATTHAYGTVSELPLEGDLYLIQLVVLNCLAKPSSAIDPKYYQYAREQMKIARANWKLWISSRVPGNGHVRITGDY